MSVAQGAFQPPESQPRRSLPGAADVASPPVAMPPHRIASATGPSAAHLGHDTLPSGPRSNAQSAHHTLCLANRPAEPSLQHAGTAFSGKLQVVLGNHALWLQFHRRQNEMIVTKPGRALFPWLAYTIRGMDPQAHYHVFVDLVPTDPHRWRYEQERWVRYAKEDKEETGNQFYVHPHSPNTGAHWMKQEIAFKKLRLTNSQTTANKAAQVILLKSLHKYQPRLHIQALTHGPPEPLAASSSFSHIFTFPETEFIAVTAYHNAEITRLKINHNPFASAMRKGSEPGQSFHQHPPVGGASANPSPEALSGDSSGAKGVSAQNQGESSVAPWSSSHGPQAPLQQTEDSTGRGALASPLDATNAGFLPDTSPPAMPGAPAQSAAAQGSSSLPHTSQGHCMPRLPSEAPQTANSFAAAQEAERPQEQIWTYGGQSDWTTSVGLGLGNDRPAKKSGLSPPDSGRDAMRSGTQVREQEDSRLAVGGASANTCPEAAGEDSSYIAGLIEGAGQDQEKGHLIPWYDIQCPQPPWQLVYDSSASSSSTPGVTLPSAPDVEDRGVLPGTPPPAMPGDAGQAAVDSLGQGPRGLHRPWMDGLLSLSPKPVDSVPGVQEGESLQEQIWTSVGQSDWNTSVHMSDERPAKQTCLSLPHSARLSMCSVRRVGEQEGTRLAVGGASANTCPEAAGEDSSYLAGLKEGAGQDKEKGYPIPWDDIQGPQPSLQHPCDSTLSSCSTGSHHPTTMLPLDHQAMIPGLLPSTSFLALLSDPTHHPLVSPWHSAPSLCRITEGKQIDSLQSLTPKPVDPIAGAREGERHQEEISASLTQSESDDSAVGPKAPKKRRLSVQISAAATPLSPL